MLHHRIARVPGPRGHDRGPGGVLSRSDQSHRVAAGGGDRHRILSGGSANALRQAPDVIFVGELRDLETVSVALHSAETGHLVLSTLHATNATTAVERVLNFFQPEVRTSTLLQLSLTLRAVVAQRLVPRVEGKGRAAAPEIMLITPRIQALIRRGELETDPAGDRGRHERGAPDLRPGSVRSPPAERIGQDDAVRFADSPNNLRLRMKGIR